MQGDYPAGCKFAAAMNTVDLGSLQKAEMALLLYFFGSIHTKG
jgi:hypothetical protein